MYNNNIINNNSIVHTARSRQCKRGALGNNKNIFKKIFFFFAQRIDGSARGGALANNISDKMNGKPVSVTHMLQKRPGSSDEALTGIFSIFFFIIWHAAASGTEV
jgi:hypothetical protein